jgi:hypothetical protein
LSREFRREKFAIVLKDGDTILMAEARTVTDRETPRDISTPLHNEVQRSVPTCAGATTYCEYSPRYIYARDFWIPYSQVLKE